MHQELSFLSPGLPLSPLLIEDAHERTTLGFAKGKSQSLLKTANGKGVGDCPNALYFLTKFERF